MSISEGLDWVGVFRDIVYENVPKIRDVLFGIGVLKILFRQTPN